MPWKSYCKPPGEEPARYIWPMVMADDVVLGHKEPLEFAKQKRKECGQLREALLAAQKLCGKEGREIARFISDMASEYMKEQRAWGFLIQFMEGDESVVSWRRPTIQEEIALYIDRACDILTFGNTKT